MPIAIRNRIEVGKVPEYGKIYTQFSMLKNLEKRILVIKLNFQKLAMNPKVCKTLLPI